MINRSWAKAFSDHIFVNIDEMLFAPLYSEKNNLRPNAPINVIVGALILKKLSGLTDDEIREKYEFDFRFQYTLHTTSFEELICCFIMYLPLKSMILRFIQIISVRALPGNFWNSANQILRNNRSSAFI